MNTYPHLANSTILIVDDVAENLEVLGSKLAEMVKELPEIDRMDIEEYMQRIIRSANRMFDLIKSFLDINAIEQGGLQVNLTPVNISLVTRTAAQSYLLKAQAKSIALHIDSGENVHGVADESVLVQVMDNLVSNALKFSPIQRNIYVRVKELGERIRIEVQDEGPGLSNEDKKKLFGKFARLSARPTAGESSTGLGLSIVKTMVEAMNGTIWCESELGHGAMFCLELPTVTD